MTSPPKRGRRLGTRAGPPGSAQQGAPRRGHPGPCGGPRRRIAHRFPGGRCCRGEQVNVLPARRLTGGAPPSGALDGAGRPALGNLTATDNELGDAIRAVTAGVVQHVDQHRAIYRRGLITDAGPAGLHAMLGRALRGFRPPGPRKPAPIAVSARDGRRSPGGDGGPLHRLRRGGRVRVAAGGGYAPPGGRIPGGPARTASRVVAHRLSVHRARRPADG